MVSDTTIGTRMTIGGPTPYAAPSEVISTEFMTIGTLDLTDTEEDIVNVQKPSGVVSLEIAYDGAIFYPCAGDSYGLVVPTGAVVEVRHQRYNRVTGTYDWSSWETVTDSDVHAGTFDVLSYLIELRYVTAPPKPTRAVLNIITP